MSVPQGQRRLASNLLREVVGRYIGNEPDSVYVLNEIQKIATHMRFELERGHRTRKASVERLMREYRGSGT